VCPIVVAGGEGAWKSWKTERATERGGEERGGREEEEEEEEVY